MQRKLLILSGIIFSGTIALNGNLVFSQTKGGSGTPGAAGQESSDKPTSKGSGASSAPSSSQDRGGSATGSGSASGGSAGSSDAGSSGSGSAMRSGGSASGASSARGMSGQSSENIKQVQEALKDKGHDPGPVDGVMGPKTQQALRAFQKESGMQATGRLDDKTASALGVDAAGSGKGSSSSGA
ncbi:MAG TPA: peptidoglycan-binding domain-containing protein, partial [Candidatus Binatia bacterium]